MIKISPILFFPLFLIYLAFSWMTMPIIGGGFTAFGIIALLTPVFLIVLAMTLLFLRVVLAQKIKTVNVSSLLIYTMLISQVAFYLFGIGDCGDSRGRGNSLYAQFMHASCGSNSSYLYGAQVTDIIGVLGFFLFLILILFFIPDVRRGSRVNRIK